MSFAGKTAQPHGSVDFPGPSGWDEGEPTGTRIHGDAHGAVENVFRRGKRAKNRRRKQKIVPTMDTIKEDAHENLNDQESEMLNQIDAEYQRGPAWSSGVAPGGVVAPRQGRPKIRLTDQTSRDLGATSAEPASPLVASILRK